MSCLLRKLHEAGVCTHKAAAGVRRRNTGKRLIGAVSEQCKNEC